MLKESAFAGVRAGRLHRQRGAGDGHRALERRAGDAVDGGHRLHVREAEDAARGAAVGLGVRGQRRVGLDEHGAGGGERRVLRVRQDAAEERAGERRPLRRVGVVLGPEVRGRGDERPRAGVVVLARQVDVAAQRRAVVRVDPVVADAQDARPDREARRELRVRVVGVARRVAEDLAVAHALHPGADGDSAVDRVAREVVVGRAAERDDRDAAGDRAADERGGRGDRDRLRLDRLRRGRLHRDAAAVRGHERAVGPGDALDPGGRRVRRRRLGPGDAEGEAGEAGGEGDADDERVDGAVVRRDHVDGAPGRDLRAAGDRGLRRRRGVVEGEGAAAGDRDARGEKAIANAAATGVVVRSVVALARTSTSPVVASTVEESIFARVVLLISFFETAIATAIARSPPTLPLKLAETAVASESIVASSVALTVTVVPLTRRGRAGELDPVAAGVVDGAEAQRRAAADVAVDGAALAARGRGRARAGVAGREPDAVAGDERLRARGGRVVEVRAVLDDRLGRRRDRVERDRGADADGERAADRDRRGQRRGDDLGVDVGGRLRPRRAGLPPRRRRSRRSSRASSSRRRSSRA